MLAALLAEDTKPETLRKMLASFLEIQPASSAPAAAPAAAPAKAPEPPAPVSERFGAQPRWFAAGLSAIRGLRYPGNSRLALRLAGLLFTLSGSPGKAERRDPKFPGLRCA